MDVPHPVTICGPHGTVFRALVYVISTGPTCLFTI